MDLSDPVKQQLQNVDSSVTQAEVPPSIPASGAPLEEKLQFIIDQLRLAQEDLREACYENPDMEESRYLDRQNARAINRKFE